MYTAAVVFTAKSVKQIIEEGGTSSWRLNLNHARRCTYAVCTRNAHPKASDWGGKVPRTSEDHQSAFLIGKVKDVAPSSDHEGRWLIQFTEYAQVNIPDVWKGDRNPVKYSTLDALGIDPSTLTWVPMPDLAEEAEAHARAESVKFGFAGSAPETPFEGANPKPLTIADAKKGLALTFGVSPDTIEITIRG